MWRDDSRNPIPDNLRPDMNTEFIFTTPGEIEQWVLPVITLTTSKRISREEFIFANTEKIQMYADRISEDLVFQLKARIANKDLGSFTYPKDWKQAFKERWFPEWLLKKYPVQYETYTAKAFYPSIKIPEHEEFVHFYKKGRDY